jgi:hypothetical protein
MRKNERALSVKFEFEFEFDGEFGVWGADECESEGGEIDM